jgi:DNA-binding SARP family transcriptional activator
MALSRLRRVGGEECSVPANWLAVKHKRVSLVRSVCKVDALEFVRSMKRSSDFKDDKRFSKALGLYTNDFLPDDDTPWTNSFRSHLRNLFIEGVLRLASMKNTENEVLFHFLEQACQSDPLHEDVYACLMKYYIKAGCPAYALNIFNKAEKVIFLQTGLYPGATLQSLAVQAKDSKPDHKLFLSCHIGKK